MAEETAALASDMAAFARRYVVLTEAQATAFGLWAMHTHAFDAAECTAYLAITSAEKQSGKTRLGIEVAGSVVANPIPTLNTTVAALFRSIGTGRTTLLFDEMDAVWSAKGDDNEALRGVLNGGHKRGAVARRCVGEGSKQTVKPFPIFCPKALIGIGSLPDTVADRSIPIRLKRRAPGEHIERARPSTIEKAGSKLRERAAAWAGRATATLTDMRPDLPDALSDRAQDGAEPLLAIADMAAAEWPERARSALILLHAEQHVDDEQSRAIRLLSDIRAARPAAATLYPFSPDHRRPVGISPIGVRIGGAISRRADATAPIIRTQLPVRRLLRPNRQTSTFEDF